MGHPRVLVLSCVVALTGAAGCSSLMPSGEPPDDEAMVRARAEGLTAQEAARRWYAPPRGVDYFPGMDQVAVLPDAITPNGVDTLVTPVYQLLDKQPPPRTVIVDPALDESEKIGRNAWMLWCGGNEAFWDWLANNSFGFLDLLKVIDTRNRPTRFRDAGLINEPGMTQAGAPSADEFGLWLDVPTDPKVREWRRAYVSRVFAELRGEAAPASGGSGGVYGAPAAASQGGSSQDYPYPPKDAAVPVPPPEIYGLSSGVVGLRLFPNPKFDAEAQRKWENARRYYDDADFYEDPKLERPYRVGMSCAFCHASYHPLKPPRDIVNPGWENISGSIGAQYLRIRAVFGNLLSPRDFIYHVLDSQPPGTIDTSLIASDNINNPNAMNAIFNVPQRALVSFRNPKETLVPPAANLPSLWRTPRTAPGTAAPSVQPAAADPAYPVSMGDDDFVPERWANIFAAQGLAAELAASNDPTRRVPRILFDGADSIGAWGALSRVYLNIGTYYEQWIRLHQPIIGFRPQQPFGVDAAQRHSVYWHATQLRVGPLRDYFLKVTPPMPLVDAGAQYDSNAATDAAPAAAASVDQQQRLQRIDVSKLAHGRRVFARNCIVCHSSIQPEMRLTVMKDAPHPGELWDHDPGQWLRNPAYVRWAEEAVEQPDFWRFNYLSTDYRIPVNVVGTNSCRAMATNAITGNMWEDFASESYRSLPSVGAIPYFNPFKGPAGEMDQYLPRHGARPGAPEGGGGPGFYRVPTLVSIWATAPLLHNNSLGIFNNDPSVSGRLAAFDDAIRKLLWPERRLQGSGYNEATPERLRADHGLIWRTTEDTYLTLKGRYLPETISRLGVARRWMRAFVPDWGNVRYPWLPTAVLMAASLILLLVASRKLVRYLGYASLATGLVLGLGIYFWNGEIGTIEIGPIPRGTPVSLLANLNPEAEPGAIRRAAAVARDTFTQIESQKLTPEDAHALIRQQLAPELMTVSRCPDLVMDRGHYFEWFRSMSDADKEALIELLKTF